MELIGRISDLVNDWKYLIRQDGVMSVLPIMESEITHLPYRHLRFVVFARVLSLPIPILRFKIKPEIRPFELSDLEQVKNINRPSEANFCGQRIAHGHNGLVAIYQGQLIGYAWGCQEVNPDLDSVYGKLEPGDVLCTDVYTAPAFRGNGVQTALTSARFQLFRDMGYKRAVCYIRQNNAPSMAVWQRKFDSLIIGYVDYIRIGLWRWIRHYHNNC